MTIPPAPACVALGESMKNVAIVGTTEHREDAPYADPEWEVWGLSVGSSVRFDRWFELHNLDRKRVKEGDYIDRLAKADCRVVICEPDPQFPNADIYPKQKIISRFGKYWTNSVAWMIALALDEWLDAGQPAGWQLGLWGVDMATNTEYEGQRPSVEYMLGWAQGLFAGWNGEGIRPRLYITPKSDLLKARRLYGFDDAEDSMATRNWERWKILHSKKDQCEEAHATAERAMVCLEGRLLELEHWLETDSLNGHAAMVEARKDELRKHLQEARRIRSEADQQRAVVAGAIENQKWVLQGL